MQAPIRSDEDVRLRALLELLVLDTPPEEALDECVSLIAEVFCADRAAVTLVDRERQWFKAVAGRLPREIPREESICALVIATGEMLVVPDASVDPRFAGSMPKYADLPVRFYAGVPLRSADGLPVGTLFVMDTEPREPTERQLEVLRTSGEHIELYLDLRLLTLWSAASAEDATARVRAVERIEHRRAEATRMLVHDLKNPLTVIRANAAYALREATPEIREALADILLAAKTVQGMLSDVLDVAASESGRLRMSTSEFDLGELAGEAARRMKPVADERGRRIVVASETISAAIRADRRLIDRLLRNLLENALKYGPASGVVRVVVRDSGPELLLCVEDDGPGIPPDMCERIFEPFERLARDGDRRGYGLGLAFCKRVAQRHGGSIHVEPAGADGGNVFCVRLPKTPPDGAPVGAATA